MALDNARLESLAEASQLARAAGSEQSSESEDIKVPSKSKPNNICAKEQQRERERERQRGQPLEYKYSPLSGDSDVDSDVGESMSDESIALLAHEMLCCEHESDTDSGEDEQQQEEEEDKVTEQRDEDDEDLELEQLLDRCDTESK
ncbi:major centromere autoantigen B-like [Drosophila novamexicana]|uniref:major centromere autoantigen B-like n=1 Tax=Drosophila novamexicana TaxID=47314 RepID=UPI0011E5EA45|nr:major centromere autoantigen B-like [Drosophila novamexicana]